MLLPAPISLCSPKHTERARTQHALRRLPAYAVDSTSARRPEGFLAGGGGEGALLALASTSAGKRASPVRHCAASCEYLWTPA